MPDLISWLRSTIEGDLAAAKAADKASPGPWVNTGQYGCGDAWQIYGAPTEESGDEWNDEAQDVVPAPSKVAAAAYEDGGGVWEREAADHMVLQQPRDTIARCEVELAIIAECLTVPGRGTLAERVIEGLARGYRHRDGYPGD